LQLGARLGEGAGLCNWRARDMRDPWGNPIEVKGFADPGGVFVR
jgi:extradiol dioxygenase family protein